jgi:hypothetical protein
LEIWSNCIKKSENLWVLFKVYKLEFLAVLLHRQMTLISLRLLTALFTL